MTEFEEEYTEFHDENNNQYTSARGYHKALIRHFKDWHPQKLSVIPRKVAEWTERQTTQRDSAVEFINYNVRMRAILADKYLGDEEKWIHDNLSVFIDFFENPERYQVEQEQLFYLKNKITGMYLSYDGTHELYESLESNAVKFTQSGIASMEVGSYKQIPAPAESEEE